MSVGTSLAEGDWSAPATRGELLLVKTELEGRIDKVASDLKSEIEGVRADLRVGLADFRVGLKDVQVSLVRMVWTAVAALGAVGILLRFF